MRAGPDGWRLSNGPKPTRYRADFRNGRSLEGLFEGTADSEHDTLAEEPLALASCYGAAAKGLGLLGPRAGQPTLRLVQPDLGRQSEPVAEVMGFNVHAQVAIDGRDRKRVERLCRYLARPVLATSLVHQSCRPSVLMMKATKDGHGDNVPIQMRLLGSS